MERYRTVRDPRTGEEYLPVRARGAAIKHDPMLNKGTAFPDAERDALGLRGVLPPAVCTMRQQIDRVYENYRRQPDDLTRHLHLVSLQDRNETLFYRLLLDHLEEMLPIVYTPTVGLACQKFSHLYRRARGLYITPDDVDRMDRTLGNAPFDDVAVMVVTDGERILGLGDQGAGGMGIPIGKLTLYTVGAGIHPARCLPVCIDIGTDNAELRDDPLYLGVRAPRLRGERYVELLDAFVEGVQRVFPNALVQWEDFARQNAVAVLNRYRNVVCSFNDDIQGTGATVLAGLLSVERLTGMPLEEQRICMFGLGGSGYGILSAISAELRARGADPRRRLAAIDSRGLVLENRPGLEEYKRPFAREPAGWPGTGLVDVVRHFRPTALIGTSGRPGSFTEEIVRLMAEHCGRPAIFALSNPTSKTEAHPADVARWTNGRALVATGSPFPGTPQGNNVLVFPGVGLGVIASRAPRVTDEMLRQAAHTVAAQARDALYPPVSELRRVSAAVAGAIAGRDVAPLMWVPDYVPYRGV